MSNNFLGIPVEGDIYSADRRTAQKPLGELTPLFQAVLDDENVVEFGWGQYTPYFNDGDPCVFSAYGVWVRTTQDAEDAEDDDLDPTWCHPTLSAEVWGTESRIPNPNRPAWAEQTFARTAALSNAIESGAFDDVLLEQFGDHAKINVNRERIEVDFYSHE